MSKSLLITFKPVDYYFFGGENTFGQSSDERNYLVRSNRLPQQTGIVGLLRHIMLEAGLNIGLEGFNPDSPQVQSFGQLHGISPLFLQGETEAGKCFLLPGSKLWLARGAELQVNYPPEDSGWGYTGGADFKTALPEVKYTLDGSEEHYTEKNYQADYWMEMSTGAEVKADGELDEDNKAKGIFLSSLHIGIDKMRRMQDAANDLDAFYKQEFLSLAPGYQFAVRAEVDEEVDSAIFNRSIHFGGENRTFQVKGEPWTAVHDGWWNPSLIYGTHSDRIVLTSDAFVDDPKALFALCRLVVAKVKPFRSIYLTKKDGDADQYRNLHLKKQKVLRYLIERGSVLFPFSGKAGQVENLIRKSVNYCNIGYNHFYKKNKP